MHRNVVNTNTLRKFEKESQLNYIKNKKPKSVLIPLLKFKVLGRYYRSILYTKTHIIIIIYARGWVLPTFNVIKTM